MTFKQKPDYDLPPSPKLAAAYRELFEPICPSEQLLAATRRLYQTAPPRWSFGRRLWPAAAATLCAACLLLTIGLQFWPQPEQLAPPADLQMRTASQPDVNSDGSGAASMVRMAAPSEDTDENGIAPLSEDTDENGIAPLSEDTVENGVAPLSGDKAAPLNDEALADTPSYAPDSELCALPPADCLQPSLSNRPIEPRRIMFFTLKILKWLVMW